jgi:hypothetical protein
MQGFAFRFDGLSGTRLSPEVFNVDCEPTASAGLIERPTHLPRREACNDSCPCAATDSGRESRITLPLSVGIVPEMWKYQAVADRFGERHGRLEVSVAVRSRRERNTRPKMSQPSPLLHLGIAQHIQRTHDTDEKVAKACGVSLAVVRQAKVRHMLLEVSPGNVRHGH